MGAPVFLSPPAALRTPLDRLHALRLLLKNSPRGLSGVAVTHGFRSLVASGLAVNTLRALPMRSPTGSRRHGAPFFGRKGICAVDTGGGSVAPEWGGA